MEDRLESMRGKLPSRAAMPAMLIAISQAALGAGIDNELIEPQNEIMRDFYVEKPIKVRMVGAYHEFGNFVSAVASLSRGVILTMRDISLEPVRDSKNRLKLEGVLTTYRYLDEEEESRLAGGAK